MSYTPLAPSRWGYDPKLGRAAIATHHVHPAAVVNFFQFRVLTVVI
jgi:hypothetical protein